MIVASRASRAAEASGSTPIARLTAFRLASLA
jgi:hypothetical protein